MGTSVDLSAILPRHNFPEVRFVLILSQGVYHQDKGVMGENCEEEDEAWLDLGQDTNPCMK